MAFATSVPNPNFGAQYSAVKSEEFEVREWLNKAPICHAMKQHSIAHAGIMQATYPFFIERPVQPGTFMLACHHGKGRVLVNGRWESLKAGQCCLLPPRIRNAFKCVKGKEWHFTWVRYAEAQNTTPVVTENSPVIAAYDGTAITLAVQGLIAECSSQTCVARQEHWVSLVHSYVMEIAKPHQADKRLFVLWKHVGCRLDYAWTLEFMAESIHISTEHLRRLCRKHLGRSPMQHLSYLRIKKAQDLLINTNDILDVICQACGYSCSYTFSNTFLKWVGCRPSEYRKGTWR